MPGSLELVVSEGSRDFRCELAAALRLGRQQGADPDPFRLLPAEVGEPARLVIARRDEANVSRRHVLLEPLPDGTVRVSNGSRVPLQFGPGAAEAVTPGQAVALAPPFRLTLGGRTVAVGPAGAPAPGDMHSLDEQTIGPASLEQLASRLRAPPALTAAQFDVLSRWFQVTAGVLQSAVASRDFVPLAAEALVQLVGLDAGRVLLLDGDSWPAAAAHPVGPAPAPPSAYVLDHVRRQRRTFWQAAPDDPAASESLLGVQTVIAAPLLDGRGAVIGALYGERLRNPARPQRPVGKLEALLVEMLAGGVSTGLARQRYEQSAQAAQARFEQFFTPELARHLAADPRLLEGRAAEVTVLFADVRGFSRVSQQIGPADTVRWINDVMGELSARVLDEGGVLVDYVGDELMGMWGAPVPQDDHPARAVRAALAMLDVLPVLDRHWQAVTGEPLALGIGVNTGPAHVGNTGSRFKFKYGPLGNTVNLASRVQGLTKYLKRPLLVTAATRAPLREGWIARRVCKTRVVNIDGEVDLYEVEADRGPERRDFFARSEEALRGLEARKFAQAAWQAGELLSDHTGDGPLLLTLYRAAGGLYGGPFDPVWVPPGK